MSEGGILAENGTTAEQYTAHLRSTPNSPVVHQSRALHRTTASPVAQISPQVRFVQQEHERMLRALHLEIDRLQTRCAELTYELACTEVGGKSGRIDAKAEKSADQNAEGSAAAQLEETRRLLERAHQTQAQVTSERDALAARFLNAESGHRQALQAAQQERDEARRGLAEMREELQRRGDEVVRLRVELERYYKQELQFDSRPSTAVTDLQPLRTASQTRSRNSIGDFSRFARPLSQAPPPPRSRSSLSANLSSSLGGSNFGGYNRVGRPPSLVSVSVTNTLPSRRSLYLPPVDAPSPPLNNSIDRTPGSGRQTRQQHVTSALLARRHTQPATKAETKEEEHDV